MAKRHPWSALRAKFLKADRPSGRVRVTVAVAVLALLAAAITAVVVPGSKPIRSHVVGATDPPPSGPPANTQLCAGGPNASLLTNPTSSAPARAITVPAGNDSVSTMSNGKLITESFDLAPSTVYWFAPGIHTLGTSTYGQIDPMNNDVFEGAPGAIIDGEGVNQSAFDGTATGVTIEYLTIEGFIPGTDAITVNHDAGTGWTITHDTITDNTGAGVGLGSDDVVTENCLWTTTTSTASMP